ncbi:hypothetical protein [Burkholderia ubonensis]|uniref:hypothetical protein n=1 Tax=Burkholderia ubonensis TaxID=101571 RepID=UPI000AE39E67|nr:hypothetical protein [Burkholderia ubonensis]
MERDDASMQGSGEWIRVASGESNTAPGSKVVVPLSLNGPPICPNVTDAEFRNLVPRTIRARMVVGLADDWRKNILNRLLTMRTASRGLFWLVSGAKIMNRSTLLLIAFVLCSSKAYACKVLELDNMQLPLNSVEIGNSDRLSVVRHFLTAREWTREGASATIDAAAFAWERNPKELAKLRGEAMKSFLVRLGMDPQDVWVQERIIQGKDGKPDPDDVHQVGVEFVPKCPPEGCQSLCNTPGLRGVASYAVTEATPGPVPDSNRFTCADKREPATARIVATERWTAHTEDEALFLESSSKPLAHVCYRITTSAAHYVGMTDERGQTERMQLLGPEYTRIEVKVDATKY